MKTIQITLAVIFLFCAKIGYGQDIDSMTTQFVSDWRSKVVYDVEFTNNPPKDSVFLLEYSEYKKFVEPCSYYAKSFEKSKYRFEITDYANGESEGKLFLFNRQDCISFQVVFSLKNNKVKQVGFIKGDESNYAYNLRRSGLFQRKIATTSDKGYLDKQIAVKEFIKEFALIIQQANL